MVMPIATILRLARCSTPAINARGSVMAPATMAAHVTPAIKPDRAFACLMPTNPQTSSAQDRF
jgi:hypothetical protein